MLVLQSNQFNHSFISTVVVAIITSNINLADAPGNVRLGKSDSGLPKASVINVSQLLTIDRGLLTDRVRSVPGAVMTKVDQGLRMVLAL